MTVDGLDHARQTHKTRSRFIEDTIAKSLTTRARMDADERGPTLAVVRDEASARKVLPVAARIADDAGGVLYVLHVRPETWNYGAESIAFSYLSGDLVDRLAVKDAVFERNEHPTTTVLLSDGYSPPFAAVATVALRYKIKTIVIHSDHFPGDEGYNLRWPLSRFRPYSLSRELARLGNDWAVIAV